MAADPSVVWAVDARNDAVWRIDPASGAVVARVPLGAGAAPLGVVSAFESVWTANGGNGTVSRIDPGSNRVVATIPVGAGRSDPSIVAGGGSIWVGNNVDNKLYKINPADNGVVPLDVGAVDRGFWRGLPVTFGLGSVWAKTARCEVARIDPVSGSVTRRIRICTGRVDTAGIAVAFDSLWVAYPELGRVRRLQP